MDLLIPGMKFFILGPPLTWSEPTTAPKSASGSGMPAWLFSLSLLAPIFFIKSAHAIGPACCWKAGGVMLLCCCCWGGGGGSGECCVCGCARSGRGKATMEEATTNTTWAHASLGSRANVRRGHHWAKLWSLVPTWKWMLPLAALLPLENNAASPPL